MNSSTIINENDLLFLVKLLIPDCKETSKMVRILREDEEILEGMLADDKLFNFLINGQESLTLISPYLFFTVLLIRAKKDIENQTYTVERDERHSTIVFDTGDIVSFLDEKATRDYLVDMLVSFVKINSFSIPIRIRKGIWQKFKYSDFDINSLIRYSQMINMDQRFHSYKRIADICLFTIGIFPDYANIHSRFAVRGYQNSEIIKHKIKDGLTKHGKYFYKAAAEQKTAILHDLTETLLRLSEKFHIAAKPLTLISDHYLGSFKESIFLH